jgi:hypothetical protein
MWISRTLWTLWALVPVGVVAFHYGPGQAAAAREIAGRLHAIAIEAELEAAEAQAAAYEAQVETLSARRATFVNPGAAAEEALSRAIDREEAAYAAAAALWQTAADRYQSVIEAAKDLAGDDGRRLRWSRGRALVRCGDIWGGAGQLEAIIRELEGEARGDAPLARAAREELAAAHYFGARLLRLAGKPAAEWRAEAALARQQYRYLAETAAARGEDGTVVRGFEDNVERVLDLEQQDRSELEAAPLPRESPRAATGQRPGTNPQAGKSRQPRTGEDARGASGVEEIGAGW